MGPPSITCRANEGNPAGPNSKLVIIDVLAILQHQHFRPSPTPETSHDDQPSSITHPNNLSHSATLCSMGTTPPPFEGDAKDDALAGKLDRRRRRQLATNHLCHHRRRQRPEAEVGKEREKIVHSNGEKC